MQSARAAAMRGRTMSPHDRARALVLTYGWNTTSYQILNPGFTLWFNRDGTAVAGYVEYHGVRVVAGVPVCEDAAMPGAVSEFIADAATAGCEIAWFAAEHRALPILEATSHDGMSVLAIGAQPVWHPRVLVRNISTHRSLRAQLNRAAAKGVHIEEWSAERARRAPELHACLRAWLDARSLPPLHFLVESDTLDSLDDRRIFVALRDAVVVGFLIATPIPLRNGWLVEQNLRVGNAPNGTTESLLFAAATTLDSEGAEIITLGLSPLSLHTPLLDVPPPTGVRALFTWLRLHGRRFYNFEGLDTFKAKFRPERWEPIYAVIGDRRHLWRVMLAITAAFGGRSAVPFTGRVIKHALEHELERVKNWRRTHDRARSP